MWRQRFSWARDTTRASTSGRSVCWSTSWLLASRPSTPRRTWATCRCAPTLSKGSSRSLAPSTTTSARTSSRACWCRTPFTDSACKLVAGRISRLMPGFRASTGQQWRPRPCVRLGSRRSRTRTTCRASTRWTSSTTRTRATAPPVLPMTVPAGTTTSNSPASCLAPATFAISERPFHVTNLEGPVQGEIHRELQGASLQSVLFRSSHVRDAFRIVISSGNRL
mmetsp:Transcript_19634/g.45908  ORF Transcript_19634/g.45908 Transcript_19634/m.45908 type:complete len:223 (+) Transcript_19634:5067-5735(+)